MEMSPKRLNDSPTLLTSPEEIAEFNQQLLTITKSLPIRTGSIFKIDSSNFEKWGIGVTDDNIEFLKKEAREIYAKDYQERRQNHQIEFLLRTEHKTTNERRMAEYIGIIVRELLHSLSISGSDSDFAVCDVPARDGRLSSAIADAIRRDRQTRPILEKTTFHLVDISEQKLRRASEVLKQFGARIVTHWMHDEEFFGKQNLKFHVIASLAHLHHKPFLVEYLGKVREAVYDYGALIEGDWHSAICSHPRFIHTLLQNLGVDTTRLDLFQDLLGERLLTAGGESLEENEKRAVIEHMNHWLNISQKVVSICSSQRPRLYIFGAFDTSKQREIKLGEAGFTTDLDKIRRAFPKARLPFPKSQHGHAMKSFVRGSDSAVAMVAVKKGQ